MFRRWRKKEPRLFLLQHEDDLEVVSGGNEDAFFDDAFSRHGGSALQPARHFIGSVVPKRRFHIGLLVMLGVLVIFTGKASALQIFQGESYRELAENNRIRTRIIPARRGIIYDRRGIILAKNDPTFQITSSKTQLPSDEMELAKLFEDLADLTETDVALINEAYAEAASRDEAILLIDDVPYETAMLFASQEQNFQGIDLQIGGRRSYITNAIPTLSHVLGYTGVISPEEYEKRSEDYRRFDHIGKQGIESSYESLLRGTYGKELIEVDALGRTERIVSKIDPIDGEDVHLTIDSTFQAYIEDVLTARLQGTPATKASVVAMDPQTGEILALVSWPSYDANLFTDGIDQEAYNALLADERNPLFPRAYAGEFPSGSTIKPVFAAAALAEEIITPSTSFVSTGGVRVSLWFFPDWRPGGHGVTNVYHAIADSVNTFFYLIGGGNETFQGLGLEKMMEYAHTFGFGNQTGIDLPGEKDGFLPSKDWKWEEIGEQWYIGDTYNTSIGQGYLLATPLQIARATAVFANGGMLLTPAVNSSHTQDGKQILSEEIAQVMKDAMRQTVTAGSATSLQSVPVPVSGKTGTAQWSNQKPNHSWFTGFAPYENPEIVLTVLIEEGADTSLAIPVTRDLLNWWFAGRE